MVTTDVHGISHKEHIMKRAIMIFCISMLASVFLQSSLYALTAREIIDRAEKTVRGDSQVALAEITIKRKRWTRMMKMKSWDNRLEKKSFAEILAPKKDAGNRFLMIKKENLMWQYNPDIGKEMKIHPSMMLQAWMGSDFTNDDIVKESSIIEDYAHSLDGKAMVDGQECYRVLLKPKPEAAVVWGKIIYYARTADCLPVKQEFYDQHDVLKKVMSCSNLKTMHGRLIPTVYKMITLKKRRDADVDEYTMMEIKDVIFDVPVENKIFTLQNLKRR